MFLVKFEDARFAHPGVGPLVVLGGAAGLVGGAAARLARGVARAAAKPAVAARLATADEARRRSGLRLGVEDVGIRVHRRPRAEGRGGGVLPVGRRAAGRARARRTALSVVQGRALGARGVVGRPLLAALGHAQPHVGVPTGLPERSARSEANEGNLSLPRLKRARSSQGATWLGSRRNSSSLVACRRARRFARTRERRAVRNTFSDSATARFRPQKPANLARVSSDDQFGKNVLRIL